MFWAAQNEISVHGAPELSDQQRLFWRKLSLLAYQVLNLGLIEDNPSRSLACSYVTLPLKAKLLAYSPQVCFGFGFLVLFVFVK